MVCKKDWEVICIRESGSTGKTQPMTKSEAETMQSKMQKQYPWFTFKARPILDLEILPLNSEDASAFNKLRKALA